MFIILNAFKPNTYSCCSGCSLLIVYVMTCNVFLSAININVIYNIYISIYIYIYIYKYVMYIYVCLCMWYVCERPQKYLKDDKFTCVQQ